MTEPSEVSDVNVSDDGNPRTGVHVSQPFVARMSRPGVMVGLVLTGLLAMLSMTILVVYLAPSVNRLTERAADGAAERRQLQGTISDLQGQLDAIGEAQLDERITDDCVSLYLSNIEVAKGIAAVTLGDSLATAILYGDGTTDEELARAVFAADTSLRDALAALVDYRAIDPPPLMCPITE